MDLLLHEHLNDVSNDTTIMPGVEKKQAQAISFYYKYCKEFLTFKLEELTKSTQMTGLSNRSQRSRVHIEKVVYNYLKLNKNMLE